MHDADPRHLNDDVARLRRFVRLRRLLYYSVLAPFAAISRISPLLVLIVGGAAAAGAVATILTGGPAWLVWALLFVGGGGLSYHALSVRLASLVYSAARSVGYSGQDVFSMWKD
ncbi:MAG: hypothetical protein ACR2OI_02545 [Acidimicrobiia bacterium]